MMMADDNDDDDFWAQQGDLIDQMVANHERERQTQHQQQHQQQPEPPTNSTPHAALSFDNPSSSVRSLPAGSRPEASPPHAPLRTFVVGADDGDPSMPQAARILLHEVTHIEVGPYAHRGQEAAKLVGRWLLERARAHQFHAAPKPKPRPLSAISANGSAGTTTQSSGGLDDVPLADRLQSMMKWAKGDGRPLASRAVLSRACPLPLVLGRSEVDGLCALCSDAQHFVCAIHALRDRRVFCDLTFRNVLADWAASHRGILREPIAQNKRARRAPAPLASLAVGWRLASAGLLDWELDVLAPIERAGGTRAAAMALLDAAAAGPARCSACCGAPDVFACLVAAWERSGKNTSDDYEAPRGGGALSLSLLRALRAAWRGGGPAAEARRRLESAANASHVACARDPATHSQWAAFWLDEIASTLTDPTPRSLLWNGVGEGRDGKEVKEGKEGKDALGRLCGRAAAAATPEAMHRFVAALVRVSGEAQAPPPVPVEWMACVLQAALEAGQGAQGEAVEAAAVSVGCTAVTGADAQAIARLVAGMQRTGRPNFRGWLRGWMVSLIAHARADPRGFNGACLTQLFLKAFRSLVPTEPAQALLDHKEVLKSLEAMTDSYVLEYVHLVACRLKDFAAQESEGDGEGNWLDAVRRQFLLK